MKNAVICEGNTDLTLLQYFLEKVYGWQDIKDAEHINYEKGVLIKISAARGQRWFKHENGNILTILSSGGVSKIPNLLSEVLEINSNILANGFDRIAIITDRDEITTEQDFITNLKAEFAKYSVNFFSGILHNNWNFAEYYNFAKKKFEICFLPLIIPFEDTGAIEKFLLDALCEESEKNDPLKIDKHVIESCIKFIDTIDCKGKYLKHRREITKAKFDTAFVVMTPAVAFSQRQTLLRSVPWERYEKIQNGFRQLSKLSEK